MLKILRLKNFQAHKDTQIEFSKGVTAFFGTSHSGKSSIIRALRLYFTQRPKGNRYIRRNQKESCEIEVFTEKQSILFNRTKSAGSYLIGEDECSALQGNVPEEVTNLLDIADINISNQLDPLFLILDTPGKAATKINSVTQLEKADQLIKNLAGDLRDTKSKVKIYNEDMEKWEQQVEQYVNVPMYEEWLCKAISFEERHLVLKERESGLEGQIETIKGGVVVLAGMIIPDFSKLAADIEDLVVQEEKLTNKYNNLDNLLDEIEECTDKIEKIGKLGDIGSLDKIDGLIQEYEDIEKKGFHLRVDIDSIESIQNKIGNIGELIKKLELEIKEDMEELDVCETCGQVLTEEAVDYMMEKV